MSRKEALDALAQTDWTEASVQHERRAVSVVHSVRFPADLSGRVEAEAKRRGLTPSALIRELVEAGLAEAERDATVTVRAADLHRAIDLVLRRVA